MTVTTVRCISPVGAAFSRGCIQKQAREIRVNAHGTGSCKGEIQSRRGGKSAKLQAGKGADPQHPATTAAVDTATHK